MILNDERRAAVVRWLLIQAGLIVAWLLLPQSDLCCAFFMCCCDVVTCSHCTAGFASQYQIDIPAAFAAGTGCTAGQCDAGFSGTYVLDPILLIQATPCLDLDPTAISQCEHRFYYTDSGIGCGGLGDGAILMIHGQDGSDYKTHVAISYCNVCFGGVGGSPHTAFWEYDHGTTKPDCTTFSSLSLSYLGESGTCGLPPKTACDGSGFNVEVTAL